MVKSQENLGQNKAHWPSINVCTVSYTGSGFIVLVGFEVSSLWFRVGALGLKAGCMERLDALVFDISLPWLQGLTHTPRAYSSICGLILKHLDRFSSKGPSIDGKLLYTGHLEGKPHPIPSSAISKCVSSIALGLQRFAKEDKTHRPTSLHRTL